MDRPMRWLWFRSASRIPIQLASKLRGWLKALVRDTRARHHLAILVTSLVVLGYAAGVLAYVVITPEIGVRCAFKPVVNQFFPEFLYPDDQKPIDVGDTIVMIGRRPVENWPQLLRVLLDLKSERAEQVEASAWPLPPVAVLPDGQRIVQVQFLRPGEEKYRSAWCRVGPPPVETLAPALLWFFLKIGLFVVGAIVYWKRPEEPYAGLFFLVCLFSVGAYIGGYHWSQILTQPILLIVFAVSSLILPAISLHFYLVFPRPKALIQRRPWWMLLSLYGPPLFFLILLLSGYLRVRWLFRGGLTEQSPQTMHLLLSEILWEIYTYFGLSAAYYLASVLCLLHSYRTAIDSVERNQVKWILFGAAAALVPIGYSLYLAFLQEGRFAGGGATWPMFAASALVTIAFTISITRYRLMQLDQLISSGMVYFVISFLAGLIYYGIVFTVMLLVGSRVMEGPSLMQALTVSTTALLLLLVLNLVRSRLKSALDRHYRKEKGQLDRTLQQLRMAVDQLVDPPTLARRLLQSTADLLGVSRGAVYLRQGNPSVYQLTEVLGPRPGLEELTGDCPLIEALQAQRSLCVRQRPQLGPAERQLLFLDGEVATALHHENQLLGLLVHGPRKNGTFSAEDLNLLTAFAQLTVVALVSAEGHRTIQNLNRDLQKKVEKIAEQQRRILMLQSQLVQGTGTRQPAADSSEIPTPLAHRPTAPPLAAKPTESSSLAPGLVGASPRIRELLALVRKVAASQSAVLLRGESGTGKEVLARVVHEHSARASGPFIKVHCAALSAGLLESELFGHVKGAFTSAIRDKVGRFEAANGGSLFLDEIGDISLEVQTKLLRVLQEMTFERVGSSESIHVDVRIIAATHQNLEELMKQGRFREDLFYRLNVFPIQVPPLRERIEDIPELVLHFLKLYAQRADKPFTGIDDDALTILKGYYWPGNVRQLENVIERAVVVADGPMITLNELPEELLAEPLANEPQSQLGSKPLDPLADTWLPGDGHNGSATTLPELAELVQSERAERERRERETVVRALAAAGGNKAEAARALGMARSTLLSRLKRLGLG